MAQPYSARQLEHFKNTLQIINSAIFEAEVAIFEANAAIDECGHTPTMPPIVETPPAQPTVVITPEPTVAVAENAEISATMAGMAASVTEAALCATETPLFADVDIAGQTDSKSFFQSVPWQAETQTSAPDEAARIADAADVNPIEERLTQPISVSSSAYFQSMPWESQISIGALPDKAKDNPAIAEVTTSDRTVLEQPSTAYFQSLPWDGAPLPIMATENATPDMTELTVMGQLATQSALQAAQRGVDKKAFAAQSASAFFHALPW
jgi:hypothetical protein